MSIPISTGSGQASVAAEEVGGLQYQRVEILGQGGASVLAVNADGSLNANITGSVITVATANQSVSGTVGASIIGLVPVQTSNSSVITVLQNSSIIAVATGSVVTVPTGNQSVSGAVQVSGASPASILTVTRLDNQILGSMLGVVGQVTIHGVTTLGSGQFTDIRADAGSGAILSSVVGLQGASVSGTVGASIIGWVPTQPSNTSTIGVIQGSVATVIIGGSIAASFTPPANQSVSGTVQTDVRGSVAAVIIGGSIAASFTPPVNQSVSGTVDVAQIGTWRTSVISSAPSSMLTGASIFGQLPAGTAMLGSVAAFQGAVPWSTVNVGSIITIQTGSVITTNVGSVIAVVQANSIAGTYAEDTAYTAGDRGLFTLRMRNDLMSSITSADLDYSGAVVGPIGEQIVANAPITKWVQGTADFRQGNAGASIVAIPSGGSSVFTYITGVQVANMGSASVLVTLVSGGSTLGYTIAPAGGGSNIIYPNALKTPANFGFAASISAIASVLVSAQGFVSRT